jgi:sporulation protein YlmC with PRC-barrel domain
MLASLRTVTGQAVITQAGPHRLGTVAAPLLDPDKGIIIAYRLSGRPAYLATVDVAGYTEDAIVTTSPDAVQPPDDLVRLKPLIEHPVKPLGLRVVSEDGQKLGRVGDFEFDTSDHRIARLHVKPVWWQRFTGRDLILPRERIVKITDSNVTVRYDSSVTSQAPLPETEIAQ